MGWDGMVIGGLFLLSMHGTMGDVGGLHPTVRVKDTIFVTLHALASPY
jgi:hypothetical protein